MGDYVWGIVDGWRRPRPEYWLTKKLFSPIRVQQQPLEIPADGQPLLLRITNRNFFSDLSRYRCHWRLGRSGGELSPRLAPQSSGYISIDVGRRISPGEVLALQFLGGDGRLVDACRLKFASDAKPEWKPSGQPARILQDPLTGGGWLEPVYLEQSVLVRLLGTNTEFALDRTSGELLRALARKEMVLYSGFSLHVMNQAEPLAPFPTGWKLTGVAARTEGGLAVVEWRGDYGSDYTGGFTYRMDDAGDLEVEYDFVYHGAEFTTREIGLSFEVPPSFETFKWWRKAEWSWYSNDEIGRPHGVAHAHTFAAMSIPPTNRPYSQDEHPWGCNDFRSAKRDIYRASFADDRGNGIRIISDGSQTVRATVGVHSIAVKILDYYGGSPSPIPEYVGLFGKGRTVRPGDHLQGKVRIQLQPANL